MFTRYKQLLPDYKAVCAHTFPALGLHSLPTKDTRQSLAAVHFSICCINMQTNARLAVCV